MKLWLSKRPNGSFMLTRYLPIKAELGKTGLIELYIAPGDPIGFINMCPLGTTAVIPEAKEMKALESMRVDLKGVKFQE